MVFGPPHVVNGVYLCRVVAEGAALDGDQRTGSTVVDEVELDAVYVVMGETFVKDVALECMEAGKHVFIEKPPGLDVEETKILADLRRVSVSVNVRYFVSLSG